MSAVDVVGGVGLGIGEDRVRSDDVVVTPRHDLLGRRAGAVAVETLDVLVAAVTALAQGADDGERSPLAVVAVVEVGLEAVAAEVDLHDPALEVVEVGLSTIEDGLGLLDGHVAVPVLGEAQPLGPSSVEERSQHGRLVEVADVDVHAQPFL